MANDAGSPHYRSLISQELVTASNICRHTYGGTRVLREHGELYLPKHPQEDKRAYDGRLKRAVLFNAFRRTVHGLSGLAFRQTPQLGADLPAGFKDHWENIDLAATHGDVFCERFFRRMVRDGHAGIFVDMAPRPRNLLTLADEQGLNLRPYWVMVELTQFLSWRTMLLPNGELILSQLVIEQKVTEPSGEYGEEQHTDYVVLNCFPNGDPNRQVSYRRFRQSPRLSKPVLIRSAFLESQERIPIAIGYGHYCAMLESEPPLRDLAELNIEHYQVRADHRQAQHLSAVPFLLAVGRTDTDSPIVVSPNSGYDVPIGGDIKYVNSSGQALTSTREDLKDIEQRMATLGLGMLMRETRAAETAEAKRLDKQGEESDLATAVRSMQDAVEQATVFHARYMGAGTEGGSIEFSRDFEALGLTNEDARLYSDMVGKGQLTVETMWDILAKNGRLPETFDPDAEKAKLDENASALTGPELAEGDDDELPKVA